MDGLGPWIAVGLAGVAQGLTGFGFGIVAMAGLTPLLGPHAANLIVTPLAGSNILLALWDVRRDVDWRRALPLWCGGILGTPVGVYILLHTEPRLLTRLIGAVILFTALTSLRGAGGTGKAIPRRWGFAAGALGGVMAGAIAMGGPPAVIYTYRQPWTLAGIKATLLLFFALTVACRLVLLGGAGSYTPGVLWSIVVYLPLTAVTTWVGSRLSERIPRRQVNVVVAVLLSLAGVGLLVKS